MREIEDDHWNELEDNDPHAGDGKAAETEQKKPRKILVEFKNISFDVRDLGRITRSFESSTRYPSGRASTMVLNMSSHPYEEKFYYENDEERDKDYEMLQMKLADLNIKYELAVPISVPSSLEEEDVEDEFEPDYEDLTDGLDGIINPE